jgi:hypothetical protein
MGREKTAPVKKGKAKQIAFTTKDGKTVNFRPTGKKAASAGKTIKALEKRLSAMEKAVIKYNEDAVRHKEKQQQQVPEGGKHGKQARVGKADFTDKGKKDARAAKSGQGEA